MNRFESMLIKLWPWLLLASACIMFTLTVPGTGEVQDWIFEGFRMVTLPVWFISGGVFGLMLSVIWERWPKKLARFSRRLLLVFFGYIAIALIIALVTGTGEGLDRIASSGAVKVWAVAVWGSLSMGPSMFGILAIMKNSKWARGASVLSFILVAAITMIFSQASRAEITSQDPYLSVGFIACLLLFVEGLNWKRRYWEEGGDVNMALWRRQAAFTLVFMAAGSAVALTPFLINGNIFSYFEGGTIIGKALMGAVLLIPFAVVAIIKGYLDKRREI